MIFPSRNKRSFDHHVVKIPFVPSNVDVISIQREINLHKPLLGILCGYKSSHLKNSKLRTLSFTSRPGDKVYKFMTCSLFFAVMKSKSLLATPASNSSAPQSRRTSTSTRCSTIWPRGTLRPSAAGATSPPTTPTSFRSAATASAAAASAPLPGTSG